MSVKLERCTPTHLRTGEHNNTDYTYEWEIIGIICKMWGNIAFVCNPSSVVY